MVVTKVLVFVRTSRKPVRVRKSKLFYFNWFGISLTQISRVEEHENTVLKQNYFINQVCDSNNIYYLRKNELIAVLVNLVLLIMENNYLYENKYVL